MGGGRLTGDGESPLLAAPSGLGPGPFGGTGMPQHLPEVVWPPLPLVLRIGVPLDSGIPSGTPGPLGTLPLVLGILKRPWFQNPPQLLG